MMKDKIYFFMTNLYGWLTIILVGSFFIPLHGNELLKASQLLSLMGIISTLLLFACLYIRIKLQIKRKVTRRDYWLVFVINAIYICLSFGVARVSLVFLVTMDFFVFLDFFTYIMKHTHIKSMFFYVISVLFLLLVDFIFFLDVISRCLYTSYIFVDVFNGILRNL